MATKLAFRLAPEVRAELRRPSNWAAAVFAGLGIGLMLFVACVL